MEKKGCQTRQQNLNIILRNSVFSVFKLSANVTKNPKTKNESKTLKTENENKINK